MKTLIHTLLQALSLMLCVCSCHKNPHPKSMQMADSIVDTAPDSAVVLLERIKDSIALEPKSTQMYYHLLSIKARDKAYMPHTTDSLILQVVHYYENREDREHLPEAYYYAGRICRDLGDAPQALDYFQKATDASGEGTDYRLLSRIYSQMGILYMYQDVYTEAMHSYKQAYYYDQLTKDSVAMVFNLRNIGSTFVGNNNSDSALYYYKKAYLQAKQMQRKSLIETARIGLASLYKQLKQYDLAKEILGNTLIDPGNERWNSISTITADLYYQIENIDSAQYYFTQLQHVDNLYIKQTAHLRLAEIAEKRADCPSILKHIHQYIHYTDSIQKLSNTETISKMQSLYNYQLRVKENNRLRAQNERQKSWIVYILFILIILTAFVVTYIQYSKRKKHQLQELLAKLRYIKDEQYKRSSAYIESNYNRIKELEKKLESTTEQNSILRALFQAQKEQIIQTNCMITTEQREQELAEAAFKQSYIYNYFHSALNDESIKPSKEDWQALQTEVDSCYKGFTTRLRSLYLFSDIEMQISLLLKSGITTTGIAKLTGRSKSAIVSARKKLYEKIYGEQGKPEFWDAFIASF